jgi:hypothetical protein
MHHVTQHENRSEQEIQLALRNFEYQAHWLNVLTLLGEQLSVPEVKLLRIPLAHPLFPSILF